MPIKSSIYYLPHTIEQKHAWRVKSVCEKSRIHRLRDIRHHTEKQRDRRGRRRPSAAAESSSSGWLKSELLHKKKENQTAERREEESEKELFARKEGSLAKAKGWLACPSTQLATPIE